MSNRIQKAIATLTMTASVLSLSGFAAFVPVVAHAATPAQYGLTEGDTIRALTSGNDPDIYIVNDWGYKRLFVNPAIFNLYGHLGWAKVKEVAVATRDAFPTSGLFRNCESGDPKVYGLDVISEDVANLRWVNTSGAQAVLDDPNFFLKVFCINNNEQALYGVGADYTSVNQVRDYNRSPSSTPIPSGPMTVSLASDNPVSGTLVDGQAIADLAHFTFTGTGTVTKLAFRRIGVSADTTMSNVYLYDGTKRISDAAAVSSGVITFNDSAGLFAVAGSKTIAVKSDIAESTSGQTVGVRLDSYTTTGNAATTTSLSGNLHSIASATLATVTLAADASITPSTNTALNPADDLTVWQDTFTVGTRYVWLKTLQYRVIGSVLVGDLRNFRLFVDGVQVGSAVVQTDANGYVVFDVSGSPVKMETGSRTVKINADVVGGSGRNFTMSLRQAADIYTVDSEYGQPILATQTGSFPADAGQQTISSGTLTITKRNDSPSGDVVKDASNVPLARFDFKANGEKLKVENLRATFAASAGELSALRNGALYADGVQIGSTQTLWEDSISGTGSNSLGFAYTEYSLGSSLIVEPGVTRVVEIRADIYDNNGTNSAVANATIQANLAVGSSNVQRLTSLSFFSSSATNGNTVTIKTGSLSVNKYAGYANQSITTPKTQFKLGHFTITAASSEDVNVNTLNFGFNGTNTGSVASKTLDVFVKVWNDVGGLVLTTPAKATVAAASSSSYSVNFTLPKSKTYQIEVIGNLDTVALADKTLIVEFSATGVTTGSSTSSTSEVVQGQTITTATGVLNIQSASNLAAGVRAGGTTVTGYAFNIQPQYDDFYIDEVYIDLSSTVASSTGAIANLALKVDGVTLSTAAINPTTASASFTIPNGYLVSLANGTKTFVVDVTFAGVGVGGNDTGGNVTVRLDGLKYRTSAGSITTTNGRAPASNTGNANLVHKAYPTFVSMPVDGTLTAGSGKVLFKTTLTPVGGTISLDRLVFKITRTNGPTLSESAFQLWENGVDVSALGTFATAGFAGVGADASGSSAGVVSFTFTNEQAVSSATIYEFKATVNAVQGTGAQSISTQIHNPSTTAITDNATDVEGTLSTTSASVVWSDRSQATHSTTTDDWMNDYLLKTLGTGSTLSVTI